MKEKAGNDGVGEGVVLGYLKLQRPGDSEVECLHCHHVAAPVWLAAISDGAGGAVWYGPLCEVCATSE